MNLTYTCSLHFTYQISCPFSIAHVTPKDQSRPRAHVSFS